MNISIWISIIALMVSVGAFIHTLISSQSKIKISLAAKRNSLRAEAHEASINLLSLIKRIIKEPQSDQNVRILEKMIETAEGLTWIYKTLQRQTKVPWRIQTKVVTEYDYISNDLQEFTKLLNKAKIFFESGDLDELESITKGLHSRIMGGTLDSEHQKSKPSSDTVND